MSECSTHCADCCKRLSHAEQDRFGYRCVDCFYRWSIRFKAWLAGGRDPMFDTRFPRAPA